MRVNGFKRPEDGIQQLLLKKKGGNTWEKLIKGFSYVACINVAVDDSLMAEISLFGLSHNDATLTPYTLTSLPWLSCEFASDPGSRRAKVSCTREMGTAFVFQDKSITFGGQCRPFISGIQNLSWPVRS